jgi:hypothetical protein
MKKVNALFLLFVVFGMIWAMGCTDKKVYNSPPGYDLNKPVKYRMPEELTEISGIAFHHGKADSLYAEEDENGRVYYLKPGDTEVKHAGFGKSGDYEDIAILGDQVVVLKSSGVLFVFPFGQLRSGTITNIQKWEKILPEGEYEGLYADEKTNQLYALCKHCSDDNPSKNCSGYTLSLSADGSVKQSGQFSINVKDIGAMSGAKKISFHPSALAKDPGTNDWYILSSVNKMLVIADADWKVKAVYPLNPSLFRQPEGITFDEHNNLYISNEGDEITKGNVLKFDHKK